MSNKKILVVDDELFIRDIIRNILEPEYEVVEAGDGEEALELITKENPAAVILDYKMPKKSGDQVCKEIRADSLRQHTPIIMLTGKKELQDKLKGLDSGADDYIVKPFEAEELIARVKAVLKRAVRDLDANPLTRLPGNITIREEIQRRIDENIKFAVLYVDLDKFKVYNDCYGFEKGDILIKEAASVILNSVESKRGNNFVGHLGGDDFVIITKPEEAEEIAKNVISEFDKRVLLFYSDEDRQKKYVVSKDREGVTKKFSLVSISIGIVTNEQKNFTHIGEVSSIGSELKNYAKKFDKSIYIKERRKD